MPSPELVILRELLAHEDRFVSGSALARKLGMSRVSIWQHMEKLREQGFIFEAARAQGYRITQRPAGLHTGLLEVHLKGRTRNFPFTVLDEADSTNDVAARRLAEGEPAPFAVFARRQTRGRGRFGRVWHSPDNGNLYASFAFRPRLAPDRMHIFTLWIGVQICELLTNFFKVSPAIKWPNDILFEERKAGGILTEARMDADEIRDLVFGLGLNVNSPAGAWPDDLARRAISLSEKTGLQVDINRFTAALIGRVQLAYSQFMDGVHEQTFSELWQRYDSLLGRVITVNQGGQLHRGIAAGLDDEGSLLMKPEGGGRLQRFRAGEVTLEKRSV